MSRLKIGLLLACTFLPSWARVAIWRLLGFRIGRGCHVSMFSIVVANQIELGAGAVIESLTMIYRPDEFTMGERARIAGFNRIIGYRGKLSLGAQTFVGLGCLIDVTGDVEVGDRSAIGPRGTFYSHGGNGLIYNMRYPHRVGPIRIGTDCWLGMGCLVQPQLTVGDRVLVLPGMVIRRDIPAGMAVIACADEYELVPTGRLLIGVSDGVLQAKLDELLCEFASRHAGSRLDRANAAAWFLRLRNGNSIALVRDPSTYVGQPDQSVATSAIWTLREQVEGATAPRFCFTRLTIYGERTPFAERVANELCQNAGVQFVFDASRSGTGECPA